MGTRKCNVCGVKLGAHNKSGCCSKHSHYNQMKQCKSCGTQLLNGNTSGYCSKHINRSGENNPFYGKTHTKETVDSIKSKNKVISTELWKNKQYRKKVIQGTSKPRSQQGKQNISKGVKKSYNKIQGLRQYRSECLKQTWQSGNMNISSHNINKSKAQFQLGQYIKNTFPELTVKMKHTISYTQNGKSKWLLPDIYIEQGNIVIQYNGDFWHMNPKLYQSNDVNSRTKKTAKECWQNDKERYKLMQQQGCKVYVVWQYDYQNNREQTLNKLLLFIKENKGG